MIFEIFMQWAYGRPIDVSPPLIDAWSKTPNGRSPALDLANRLEADGLEKALRALFVQVSNLGNPQVNWALLVLCHKHDLEKEFQTVCAEIAGHLGQFDWFRPKLLEGISLETF